MPKYNLGLPFSGIISSSLAMHHFRVANGPWVQLLSSLKAALRNNIRAVTDRDIVIVNFSQDS